MTREGQREFLRGYFKRNGMSDTEIQRVFDDDDRERELKQVTTEQPELF